MFGITARRAAAPVTDDSYPAAHRYTVQAQLDEMNALDVVERYCDDHPELLADPFGIRGTRAGHVAV